MLICISDDVRLLVQPSHTLSSCLQLYSYPKYILDTAPIYHSHLHHYSSSVSRSLRLPCSIEEIQMLFQSYMAPIYDYFNLRFKFLCRTSVYHDLSSYTSE